MKLLVYGSRGWIASQFLKSIVDPNIKIFHGESRVNDIPAIKKELYMIQPTNILCMIGRTHGTHNGKEYTTIDYLEQPGNLSINLCDNLYSPVALAILCRERGIHFTYLGTGCIYNYTENGFNDSFDEVAAPNFFGSSYSTVKGFTDSLMHLLPVLNLRIRMPITGIPNKRNFITKITNYNKICSIPNSMTVLETFFPIWLDLMRKKELGTFNCTNPGVISHNEILEMYKELVDKTFVWENFTIEEQNMILDSKRSNNKLETNKIEHLYPVLPDIKTAVCNALLLYRNAVDSNSTQI